MGHKHSKGKISHEDLQYLLKNTNHSKEEIKVTSSSIRLIFIKITDLRSGTKDS